MLWFRKILLSTLGLQRSTAHQSVNMAHCSIKINYIRMKIRGWFCHGGGICENTAPKKELRDR
jgi:hypothetical protein